MKKGLLFTIIYLVITCCGKAQLLTDYSFRATTGRFTPLDRGTPIPSLLFGDVTSSAIDIGFDFFYMGQRYRYIYVASNGYISFNPNAPSVSIPNQYTNNLSTSDVNLRPLIAPLWDHINGGITVINASSVSYQVNGTAPSRVLTIEWLNFQWDKSAAEAVISFQVNLYETRGIIEFVYQPEIGVVSTGSGGASIGLTNTLTGSGNFVSLNNNSSSPSISSSTETNTILTKPASDQVYSFEPPLPSDAPKTLSFNSITSGSMKLNWKQLTVNNESGFAIYNSTDNINFNYVASTTANATSYTVTGLYSSTTYYWQVFAYTAGALSTPLTGTQATNAAIAKLSNSTNANWNSPNDWSPVGVPGPLDSVVIRNGHVVTINTASASCYTLYIGAGLGGSVLQFSPTTLCNLTITKDIRIAANGSFKSGATGTQTGHTVSVGGNVINNGTINFSTNSNTAGAGFIFNNPSIDQSFTSGSLSSTTLRNTVGSNGGIHINKGNNASLKFSFTPGGTITVQGANTSGFITIDNGTLELIGNNTFSNPLFSKRVYSIPATAAVKINNKNATVIGQNGNVSIDGILQISAGTYIVGTSVNNDLIGGSSSSSIIIDGGDLNVAGKINLRNSSTYLQTGGTVTVATLGNTSGISSIYSTGASFVFTGGTIVLQTANSVNDFELNPTVLNMLGGTLQIGNSSSLANQSFNLKTSAYSLSFTSASSQTATILSDYTITNNLSLNNVSSVLSINGQKLSIIGAVSGTGSISGSTTSSLYIGGSGNLGTLNFTSGAQILYNFTVNRTASGNVTLGSNLSTTGSLTLQNGKLNLGANTLSINGSLNTTATNCFVANGSSNIIFASSNVNETLYLDQTSNGVTNTLRNLTINSNTVTLGANTQVSNILALTDGKLALGSNTLSINGTISGMSATNCLSSNGFSNLNIGGSGALGTNLFFDQSTNGITNQLINFTYNRTGSGNTISLGNALAVAGIITPTSGTLATNGYLKLVSNASGTASIASGTGSYITGNVIVERYIPSIARRWRFLSSPVIGSTLLDWKNEMYVTGTGGATNGFDATSSNAPTVYSYDETSTGVLNNGWTTASSISNPLTTGKGYRVFIRGDRSDPGRLNGTVISQNPVTLNLINPVNIGNIVMPVSYTPSAGNANDGWCLLGNPYPSSYNWNTFWDAASNYTNISPTIHIYDPNSNNWKSYNASANSGTLNGGIIPSGAAFFVQATAPSPSMTFVETHKTALPFSSVFKTDNENTDFTIKLIADSITSDEMIVKYIPNATVGLDIYDIQKMYGPDVNIAAISNDKSFLTLNSKPFNGESDTILLSIGIAKSGNYTFEFKNINSLTETLPIHLIDAFDNKIIDLRKTSSYSFSSDITNANSFGNSRFIIVVGEIITGIDAFENNSINNSRKITLYPTIIQTDLTIQSSTFINSDASISIYDVTGKELTNFNELQWNNNQIRLDFSSYKEGLYFVSIKTKDQPNSTVLRCVKQ